MAGHGKPSESFGTLKERILRAIKVDKNGCWIWQQSCTNTGYGKMTVRYKTVLVHRVSYEEWVDKIPEGKQLDHRCRVRRCVNPNHLEPVSCQENLARGGNRWGRKAMQPEFN